MRLLLLLAVILVVLGSVSANWRKVIRVVKNKEKNLDNKKDYIDGVECSRTFDFTYVPPGPPMRFEPLKKFGLYLNKKACGWWFWSDEGSRLNLQCSYIDIADGDYLYFYNYEKDSFSRKTNLDVNDFESTYITSDLMIGFISNKLGRDRGFECFITAEAPKPTEEIMCGDMKAIQDAEGMGPRKFPWVAALKKRHDSPDHFCGGSIISNRYVLTSAACVQQRGLPFLSLGTDDSSDSGFFTTVQAVDVAIHPQYDAMTLKNDIAVLEIPYTRFSKHIAPICLPDDLTVDYAGNYGIVAGWATPSGGAPQMPVESRVPIVSNDLCSSAFGTSEIFDDMLCASDLIEGTGEGCLGDPGSQLFVQRNGVAELAGLTSSGFGCNDPLYPGVYSRMASMIGFVESIVGDEKFSSRPM